MPHVCRISLHNCRADTGKKNVALEMQRGIQCWPININRHGPPTIPDKNDVLLRHTSHFPPSEKRVICPNALFSMIIESKSFPCLDRPGWCKNQNLSGIVCQYESRCVIRCYHCCLPSDVQNMLPCATANKELDNAKASLLYESQAEREYPTRVSAKNITAEDNDFWITVRRLG